mmetsp:Transcript_1725/g.4845  ORF Transcript_1725/g.4845 Transcript_1725/m.4845 type:complete len:150 (+) Transcript_1725:63-512(+)
MVQHVAITYADNQDELREEEEFKASPLTFALKRKARRLATRARAWILDRAQGVWASALGRALAPRLIALEAWRHEMWLRAMRMLGRPLPPSVVHAMSLSALRREAEERGHDLSLCVERQDVEQLILPPGAQAPAGSSPGGRLRHADLPV